MAVYISCVLLSVSLLSYSNSVSLLLDCFHPEFAKLRFVYPCDNTFVESMLE